MHYCINCRKEIKEDWDSCPFCGTPNVLSGEQAESDSKQKDSLDKRESDSGTIDPGTGIYGLDYDNLPSGTLIDGKYRIEEKLGKGGFGTVYKVWYEHLSKWRAIKIISREFYDDKEVIHELKSEADKHDSVNHPNVVRFYDVHLDGEIKYFDMEYIDGGDLVDLKLSYPGKRVPEERVREIALQIADGMIAIHQKNIIHKDIKPQNILLTKDGTVKIADFGIAEKFRNSRSRLKLASRAGTPAYMSPEHLIGEDVGRETDIWSFGVMMYELLTGKQLYNGESQSDVLMQIKERSFHSHSSISESWNRMLEKCLQYKYEDRFRNFGEVLSFVNTPFKPSKKKRLKKPVVKKDQPQKRNVAIFIVMILLALGGISSFLLFKSGVGKTAVSETSSVESETGLRDKVERVPVPNLRGLTIEQARSRISNAGLVVGQTTERRDNDNIGKVISSSPSSGELNRGSRIDLVVGIAGDYTSSTGIDMIFVEGGTFQMGNPSGGASDERPVHSVTLSDFYIGKHEVTQKEYQAVMGSNPSNFKGDNLPVERVSWFNAVEFCNKLSEREGLTPVYSINGDTSLNVWSRGTLVADWTANGYRLPTETEWEYAARGGNKSKGFTYSGSNSIDDVAWYGDNSGSKTHPVGTKRANELGLYDMWGNVWEWCWDWYGEYSSRAKTNPRGPANGSSAVLRGGSWVSHVNLCRVANRVRSVRSVTYSSIGFRVARTRL